MGIVRIEGIEQHDKNRTDIVLTSPHPLEPWKIPFPILKKMPIPPIQASSSKDSNRGEGFFIFVSSKPYASGTLEQTSSATIRNDIDLGGDPFFQRCHMGNDADNFSLLLEGG